MSEFRFRKFSIRQEQAAMKVGTDSMVLGAFLPQQQQGKALDIGTGTGVLALMLAQRNPQLTIDAVEIDPMAALEAAGNVERSAYRHQIKVYQLDFCSMEATRRYELIVSNPPYFENSYKSEQANRNTARHNDQLPLKLLLQQIEQLLSESGRAYLILPLDIHAELKNMLSAKHLHLQQEIVLYGKTTKAIRAISVLSKNPVDQLSTTNFQIRDEKGLYTPEYIQLTHDFHDRDPNQRKK